MRRTIAITPNVKYVKLLFNPTAVFSVPSGSSAIIAMNDLVDPGTGLTGSQPVGFDQWMLFYSRFEVIASRIRLQAYGEGDTTGSTFTLYPSIGVTPVSAFASKQQPYGQVKNMAGAATGNQYGQMISYLKTRTFEGRSVTSIDYTGTKTLSPENTRYWIISAFAFDGVSTFTLNMDIHVTYYVKFYNRTNLADETQDFGVIAPVAIPEEDDVVPLPAPVGFVAHMDIAQDEDAHVGLLDVSDDVV